MKNGRNPLMSESGKTDRFQPPLVDPGAGKTVQPVVISPWGQTRLRREEACTTRTEKHPDSPANRSALITQLRDRIATGRYHVDPMRVAVKFVLREKILCLPV